MKTLLTLVLALTVVAGVAGAQPFYAAGDFNGWNATSDQMVDDGTNGDAIAGDGIHSLLINVATANTYLWKATEYDWAASWPVSGNSWYTTTSDGEDVLLTFNINTVGDGWLADGFWPFSDHNVGVLNLVGDLQDELGDPGDWDPNGGLILHDDGLNGDETAGDGYFTFTGSLQAGTFYWKVVFGGTWNAIGADGAGVNSANMELILDDPSVVYFVLDTFLGRLYAGIEAPVGNDMESWGGVKAIFK